MVIKLRKPKAIAALRALTCLVQQVPMAPTLLKEARSLAGSRDSNIDKQDDPDHARVALGEQVGFGPYSYFAALRAAGVVQPGRHTTHSYVQPSAFPKVTLQGVARALKLALGKADAAAAALLGDLQGSLHTQRCSG